MTALRQRMLEDMQIRNLSSSTQRAYVENVSRFARHFGRSPAGMMNVQRGFRQPVAELKSVGAHIRAWNSRADFVHDGVAACGGNDGQFIRPMASVVALAHVRVIDGTGGPGKDDQTVIIGRGRISTLGAATAIKVPAGASTLDLHGRTVIPGLVGMHDHLFYQFQPGGSTTVVLAQRTFARLYLAGGVTTPAKSAMGPGERT